MTIEEALRERDIALDRLRLALSVIEKMGESVASFGKSLVDIGTDMSVLMKREKEPFVNGPGASS